MEEARDRGRREGRGTITTEGGGGRSGENTLKRRELQRKGPEPREVTQKQRLEERQDHHSHDTTRGT